MQHERSFVIGGCGFIGSHLVDLLVDRGPVTVYDNLSVGRPEFIDGHLQSGAAVLVRGDVLDVAFLQRAMRGHDVVYHLSANPDARRGLLEPDFDLQQGTVATFNVVNAVRQLGIGRLVFSSSGTVYGNTAAVCAEGDLGNLPISLYGASKMAGEALIAAAVECFGLTAYVCRFGNVIGPRATHGAIFDFCNKLKAHPDYLDVLGDGRQAKPYLHVTDCAAGILHVVDRAPDRLNVYNLAPYDTTSVARIAELCVAASPNPQARIEFTGGNQGWLGDVPVSRINPAKLADLGYVVRYSSDRAVEVAIGEVAHEVFDD